jgi:hypothetical protein
VLARRPANAITADVAGAEDRLLQQRAWDDRQKQQQQQQRQETKRSGDSGEVDIRRRQALWDQHYSQLQFVLPVSNGFELLLAD